MGRAIDMEKHLHALEQRVKLVEDALTEMIQTRVHHVDLHDEMDKHEEKVREENTVLKPDEEYTAPIGKRKKTVHKTKATATT
jgi:hypothetical protein